MTEMTNSEFFSALTEIAKQSASETVDFLEKAIDGRFQGAPEDALVQIHRFATGTAYQGAVPSIDKIVTDIGTNHPKLASPLATIVVSRDLNVFKPN